MPHVTIEQARAAREPARLRFARIGTVVGVGLTRIGEDYAVKINLDEAPKPGAEVPTEIDGVPIRVEITGTPTSR